MKTLLILILLAALGMAAAASRPDEQAFRAHVHAEIRGRAEGFFDRVMVEHRTKAYLKRCEYRNRLLWAEVVRDGKTVYTGAFGQWLKSGA